MKKIMNPVGYVSNGVKIDFVKLWSILLCIITFLLIILQTNQISESVIHRSRKSVSTRIRRIRVETFDLLNHHLTIRKVKKSKKSNNHLLTERIPASLTRCIIRKVLFHQKIKRATFVMQLFHAILNLNLNIIWRISFMFFNKKSLIFHPLLVA